MIVWDNSDKESLRLDYKNDGFLFDVAGNLYKGDITIARGIQGAINQARSSDEGFDKMLGELESSNNTHERTNKTLMLQQSFQIIGTLVLLIIVQSHNLLQSVN